MGDCYLLTGPPGVGKTTAIKAIMNAVGVDRFGGFYSEEVVSDGRRTGFRMVTLDGSSGLLASIDLPSEHRIAEFGVDIGSVDTVAVAAMREALQDKRIIVIDEIGPMELFSETFRDAVLSAIQSEQVVLGTIVYRPYPWADELKRRPQVSLIELTIENRDDIVTRLIQRFASGSQLGKIQRPF